MATERYTLDPANPPKLSDNAKRYLDHTPDEDIDYSEIPDMGDLDWDALIVDPPRRPKPQVTMRLPEDVVRWFQADDPKGYTGRMAAVLTAYVEAQEAKGKGKGAAKDAAP